MALDGFGVEEKLIEKRLFLPFDERCFYVREYAKAYMFQIAGYLNRVAP
jgi:hypothetical protein